MERTRSSRAVGRRRFLAGLAGVIACATLNGRVGAAQAAGEEEAPAAAEPGPWTTLGRLSEVVIGSPVGFPFTRPAAPSRRRRVESGVAYVVTHDGRTAAAFANLCTHHGCRVSWDCNRKAFLCPCHNGAFDIDGINIEGCPQRPLERFETRIVDGLIQIRTVTA